MAYDFKNLMDPQNINPGIAEFLLAAPMSWFEDNGIKSPVAPFTVQGDEITVKLPHVFKAGKAFMKFQLAPQKNDLKIDTKGDLGLSSQTQTVNIFIPGSYVEQHETMKNLINTPLIVLVKDANCAADLYYMLGCDCTGAYARPSFATSTTKDGNKGYTVPIEYDGAVQFYQVTGGPDILT